MVAKCGDVDVVNYERDEAGWWVCEPGEDRHPVASSEVPADVRWECADEIRDFWRQCPSGMRMIRYLFDRKLLQARARQEILRALLPELTQHQRECWRHRLGANNFAAIVDEFVLRRRQIDPAQDARLANIVRSVRTSVPDARELPNDGIVARCAAYWRTRQICEQNGLGFSRRRREPFLWWRT